MALHLVTGYAGKEHVTANDQGSYQMATYGSGEFVLNRGTKFEITQISNNTLQVGSGEAMMQGRYIKLNPGTTEEVHVENGEQGKKRNDLLCIRYERDTTMGVESAKFIVVKGIATTGDPADPEIETGSITDGSDAMNDLVLYRIKLEGLSIVGIEKVYQARPNMMDNEFVLVAKKKLDFVNLKCKIEDDRITADSIADVYFTTETISAVEEAGVVIDTYDGYAELSAVKAPTSDIIATIFVRVVI